MLRTFSKISKTGLSGYLRVSLRDDRAFELISAQTGVTEWSLSYAMLQSHLKNMLIVKEKITLTSTLTTK
jgi:hypothetical protein